MKIYELVKSLRACAEYPNKKQCTDECPVYAQTVTVDRPWCCFNMYREAADQLEKLSNDQENDNVTE